MSKTDFMEDGFDLNEPQQKDVARVGRPVGSVKPDERKRTVLIQFRVTPDEAEQIDTAMQRNGCASRSHFVRSAVNDELDRLGIY